ncbi:MAG: integrase [Methylobacterium sp.]|nr:integrase [Methylobacterium sp.]
MLGMTTTARLKYVTTDVSEGITRYYLRLPGEKTKARLPGQPGEEIFMEAYWAGLKKLPQPRRSDGTLAKADAKGTLSWLVDEYFRSAAFKGLAEATQGARRNILKVVLSTAGNERVVDITEDVIRAARDRRASTPAAANTFLKAMSHLFTFAIEYKHAKKNPVLAVERVKHKSEGHHTWSEAEINRFLEAYPLGTMAHLCMCIMLYTGVRVSDAAVMGRQHVHKGYLSFRAQKNKVVVDMPVAPELQAAIEAVRVSRKGHMHFLINEWDKPFSVKGLGQRMRKWCDTIGLNHCSSHGIRKAGATIAADNGASEHELMATFGWESPKQAALYTKKANRRRLAGSGAAKITLSKNETANKIVPPSEWVETRRDNEAENRKEISA